MTSPPPFAKSLSTEAPDDDWVLAIPIKQPGQALSGAFGGAAHGPLRCFFHGLLYDRALLADSHADRLDCSDAELVLRCYEREGEGAFSRLRGSFVVAVIDGARDLVIVARDQLGSHPLFY